MKRLGDLVCEHLRKYYILLQAISTKLQGQTEWSE